jgi:thymidylate synthase
MLPDITENELPARYYDTGMRHQKSLVGQRIAPDTPSPSINKRKPQSELREEPAGKRFSGLTAREVLFDSQQETQEAEYTPHFDVEDIEDRCDVSLKCDDGTYYSLADAVTDHTIGRSTKCSIKVSSLLVSRKHAVLTKEDDGHVSSSNPRFSLTALETMWILVGHKWETLEAGKTIHELKHGTKFSLAPPAEHCPQEAQFLFHKILVQANPDAVGSESFDRQYLELLRRIEEKGSHQENRKGGNWTLQESFHFDIDLRSPNRAESLVPITTLRKMYGGRKAVVEALWYIRGEADIKFLEQNNCNFWDQQARQDGFVGLNYGLLTNWPNADGTSRNQLEEDVIQPLCEGKSSRNMVCTLCKPGEETVQVACTTSVQFSITSGNELSLTVTQRSSDVILGLPNDVIAWTVVLHLVRHEVYRRARRELKTGRLLFSIAQGGAHVYTINEKHMYELLARKPKLGVRPSLKVDSEEGIFEIARIYSIHSDGGPRLPISGYGSAECYHPALVIAQAK